jgi:hypothetical protein
MLVGGVGQSSCRFVGHNASCAPKQPSRLRSLATALTAATFINRSICCCRLPCSRGPATRVSNYSDSDGPHVNGQGFPAVYYASRFQQLTVTTSYAAKPEKSRALPRSPWTQPPRALPDLLCRSCCAAGSDRKFHESFSAWKLQWKFQWIFHIIAIFFWKFLPADLLFVKNENKNIRSLFHLVDFFQAVLILFYSFAMYVHLKYYSHEICCCLNFLFQLSL